MKKYILILLSLPILMFTACDKDNFEEPKAGLQGKLVTTTGTGIGVKGSSGSVQMQLYQVGYGLHQPIAVYVDQEGNFTAKLFNGDYKLVTRDNNGPWVNHRDTVEVKVKGNTPVEYKVTPYFLLSNENFTVANDVLTATFDLAQITEIEGRNIESVTLYVNNTAFVDDSFKKKTQNVENPKVGTNTVSMNIKDIAGTEYHDILFARIGVKISGVGERLYTTGSVKVR